MPRVAFTAKTRKYLGSLDAVESVTQYRICYSKEFRDDCMRRYAEGGSPAAIFREAGLDPKIIGYKRVERCIARWKAEDAEKATEVAGGKQGESGRVDFESSDRSEIFRMSWVAAMGVACSV